MSRTTANWCLVGGFLVGAWFASTWEPNAAKAAKPPPPPPPAGKIYFTQLHTTYQMSPNGSGKVALGLPSVLPTPGGGIQPVYLLPSSRTYGGLRWWLTYQHTFDEAGDFAGSEVFAYQEGNSQPVQVTAMAADNMWIPGIYSSTASPRWSGDGLDSFISFIVRDNFDENAPNVRDHLCRIWIDGDDIAAIAAGAPPLTAGDFEFLFTDFSLFSYGWSSDPDVLAYRSGLGSIGDIRVRVLGQDPENPVADYPIVVGVYGGLPSECWSPDDTRITFTTGNTQSWGGVWTVNADGSNLRQVATNTSKWTYGAQLWSPDGSQLLITTVQDRGPYNPRYYNLARMPAAGGTITVLTGDMNPEFGKTAKAWFP